VYYDGSSKHLTLKGGANMAFDYNAYMENIRYLLEKAELLFPGKNRFLYGHSLGGNLVVNYALRNKPEIKGIIVTGPWFRLTHPPKPSLQSQRDCRARRQRHAAENFTRMQLVQNQLMRYWAETP
jgi:alpha-beta hydrolase superfamily lysophospholipase